MSAETSGVESNLGFEASDEPDGWHVYGRAFTAAIDNSERHEGSQSLKVSFDGQGSFGAVAREYPVARVRGKRVRVTTQLKTYRTIAGWGRVWVDVSAPSRVDGLERVDQRLWGQIEWSPYEITVDVPADATSFHYGALLAGSGQGWFDSFTVQVVGDAEVRGPTTIAGRIANGSGAPVPGAVVAAVAPSKITPQARTTTDDRGLFSMQLPVGVHGLTITADGYGGAYVPPESLEADEDIRVTLGPPNHVVSGRLTQASGVPIANALVAASRNSSEIADLFYCQTDAVGRYRFAYSEPGSQSLLVVDDAYTADWTSVEATGPAQTVDLVGTPIELAPDELVAWLRTNARALAGVDIDLPDGDLAALEPFVGKARVVALGEATHGTREFFQLKARVFRYLVEHLGFTAIAFELSLAETQRINEYVLHGTGDPRQALGAAFFWIYNTEEVLELVEWMRAYNSAPGRSQKIQFLGFDMQFSDGAEQGLFAYLHEVDRDFGRAARVALLPLVEKSLTSRNFKMSEQQVSTVSAGLSHIRDRLESQRDAYVARTSDERWQLARQYLRVLEQLHEMLSAAPSKSRPIRDQAMTENTLWHLARQPNGGRIALWAHNLHLARNDIDTGYPSQGKHLARQLGDDYRALGFVFNQGSFQAYDYTGVEKDGRGIRSFHIGRGSANDIGRNFARLGQDIFFADFQRLEPGGKAAQWLQSGHPMKILGSGFSNDVFSQDTRVIAADFDGIIFVNETTRARPLHETGWRFEPTKKSKAPRP